MFRWCEGSGKHTEKLAWCLATKTINNIKIEKETVLEWKWTKRRTATKATTTTTGKKGHTINAPSYCASVYASLFSYLRCFHPLVIVPLCLYHRTFQYGISVCVVVFLSFFLHLSVYFCVFHYNNSNCSLYLFLFFCLVLLSF